MCFQLYFVCSDYFSLSISVSVALMYALISLFLFVVLITVIKATIMLVHSFLTPILGNFMTPLLQKRGRGGNYVVVKNLRFV